MDTAVPARPRRRRQQRQEETIETPVEEVLKTIASTERAPPPLREEPRDEPRGDPRGETSRELADRRADEILRRTAGQDTDFHDDFDLSKAGVYPPDGWEYQWKTRTVLGAENPGEMVALEMAGWSAVPASRHPELMPSRGGHFEVIERGGQILMECPSRVTEAQRIREYRKAMERMDINRQRLGAPAAGTTFQRNNGKSAGADPQINKTYEPIAVPKE